MPAPLQEEAENEHPAFQAVPIPIGTTSLFYDPLRMLFLLQTWGIASRVCTLLQGSSASTVPYLGILAAPTFLYHAAQRTSHRLGVMICAVSTGRLADAFFWGGRAADSLGTAVGTSNRTFSGIMRTSGLAEKMLTGLLFTAILPILLVVLGVMGTVSQAGGLWRSRSALRAFDEKASGDDERACARFLNFLHEHNVLTTTIAPTAAQKVEIQNFKQHHFTNDQRGAQILQKVATLLNTTQRKLLSPLAQLQKAQEVCTEAKIVHRITTLLENAQNASTPEDFLAMLSEMSALYGALADHIPDAALMKEKRAEVRACRDWVLQEGSVIKEEMRAEIHRAILYHAIFFIAAALFLAEGILLMQNPTALTTNLPVGLTACILEAGVIIFERTVSKEDFMRMKRALGIKN